MRRGTTGRQRNMRRMATVDNREKIREGLRDLKRPPDEIGDGDMIWFLYARLKDVVKILEASDVWGI